MFDEKFFALCESAADTLSPIGTERSSDKKFLTFSVFLNLIGLELVFKRSSLGQINNVLYCRVYPNKASEFFYLLPEAFVELNIQDLRSVFFPMIENEERLEACFRELWSIISEHLPRIEDGAAAGLLPISRTVTESDIWERRLMFPEASLVSREPFVISAYTGDPAYRALLAGDSEKAVKRLEKLIKKDRAYEYQIRLCEYLKAHPDFSPMPDECNALRTADAAQKRSLPKALAILAVTYAVFAVFFVALALIFNAVFSRGTAAYFGAPWYCGLLLAALPAMFGAVFFRRKLIKLLFPRSGRAMIERDRAASGALTERLSRGGFIICFALAIIIFPMMFLPALRIYEDRLDASSKSSVFTRETYRFEDIGEICHISARYNDYGDRIERPSYVLVMKDGRQLDLDSGTSDKQAEEELFPLLEKYAIPVRMLDSDKELP